MNKGYLLQIGKDALLDKVVILPIHFTVSRLSRSVRNRHRKQVWLVTGQLVAELVTADVARADEDDWSFFVGWLLI